MSDWAIVFVLPAVASIAGQRRVRPLQLERRLLIVGEQEIVSLPSRFAVASTARSLHLSLMRVLVAIQAVAGDFVHVRSGIVLGF